MKARILFFVLIYCLVGASLVGCGQRGPKRYSVSGEVTFEGAPVVDGMIMFTPDSRKGNTGPQGYAIIKDGKYGTDKKHGVLEGPTFATLTGYSEPHAGQEVDPRRPLFTEVNEEFEMPAKKHSMDFHLTREKIKQSR